jgi:hypothetical protein
MKTQVLEIELELELWTLQFNDTFKFVVGNVESAVSSLWTNDIITIEERVLCDEWFILWETLWITIITICINSTNVLERAPSEL